MQKEEKGISDFPSLCQLSWTMYCKAFWPLKKSYLTFKLWGSFSNSPYFLGGRRHPRSLQRWRCGQDYFWNPQWSSWSGHGGLQRKLLAVLFGQGAAAAQSKRRTLYWHIIENLRWELCCGSVSGFMSWVWILDIRSVTTHPAIRCGAYLPKVSRDAEILHSIVLRGLCGMRWNWTWSRSLRSWHYDRR